MKTISTLAILTLVVLLMFGCTNLQQQSAQKPRISVQPDYEQLEENVNEEFRQSCRIETPSENVLAIGEFLKSNDYKHTSKIENKDFSFTYCKNLKSKVSLTYLDCHYIEHSFNKVKPINGNYYPSFRIVEFCFDSKGELDKHHKNITLIINQQEKNYGYLMKDDNRILYVQTGVNMFGFIINNFKEKFEKIIRNGD